jgi:hypothetical protein
MMLLSKGLSHKLGKPFDDLLHQYVFSPIGMTSSYALNRPSNVKKAQGHRQTGQPVPAWTFPADFHGAGGIHSSLNDMIKFLQANLDLKQTAANKRLKRTHKEITKLNGQSIGMNWMLAKLNGRTLMMHEGGTGGFSSLIAFDPVDKLGIVIFSDTSMTSLGGLSPLALHLLDSSIPAPTPRKLVPAQANLLEQLSGLYTFADTGMQLNVWEENGNLYVQATGQAAYKMGYDNKGDFFPLDFDAILRPVKTSKGITVEWHQSGGISRAEPVSQSAPPKFKIDRKTLPDYVGVYPLIKGFDLKVTVKGETLYVQGTGQPSASVVPVKKDEFARDDVGAYFIFNRNSSNQVHSLTLEQGGQSITGVKQ